MTTPYEPTPPYFQPAPAAKPRSRAVLASAAAVILIGGGAATYVAVSDSDPQTGAATPREAVQTLVSDLNNSDLVGLLDDLPPAERTSLAEPVQRTLQELKRNDVLAADADLSKVSGLSIHAADLTFADNVVINDHVQIVRVTDGTLSLSADAAKLPLTRDFFDAARRGSGKPPSGSRTIDIGDEVARTGKPLRIATQLVDGRWYPSVLYSIADNVVTQKGLQAPAPGDRIPAVGAASPDAAVRGFLARR